MIAVELGPELILLFVCLAGWRSLLVAGIAVVTWIVGGSDRTFAVAEVSVS